MAKTRRSQNNGSIRRPQPLRSHLNAVVAAAPGVVIAVLLAAVAVKVAVAAVFQTSRPGLAMSWQPNNAAANANLASRLLAANRNDDAGLLAQNAVRRGVLAASAYATLGRVAENSGDGQAAFRFMNLTYALSRRERTSQVWLIQNAVRTRDYDQAVRFFDVAMRTSTRGQSQLLPLLIAASADRAFVAPLAGALAREPTWKASFLRSLVETGPNIDHVALLTFRRLDPAQPEERVTLLLLIRRLVQLGRYDLAWTFYRAASRNGAQASASSLRDPGYSGVNGFPPLDWQLGDDPGLSAVRETRRDGAPGMALALVAESGRTGEVARQLVRLEPGNYVIEATAGAIPDSALDRPQIAVLCAASGAVLYTLTPSRGGAERQRIGGRFTVSPGCAWHIVSIRIASAEAPADLPWVAVLTVRRAP